jgi:hypothetical protein
MANTELIGIDFGSENIRLSRGTQNVYSPQVLPSVLLNAIRVEKSKGVTAVGDAVYKEGKIGFLINSINLFDEEMGAGPQQALQALLGEIFRRLELGRLSSEQIETIFSIPIGVTAETEVARARLLEQGFPAPHAIEAAKAIFYSYYPDGGFQPGTYLILDCGASQMRMALCKVDSSKNLFLSAKEVSGNTGGKEIEILLYQHFANDVDGIKQAELLFFLREFKEGLLNQFLQGNLKNIVRSPFSSGPSFFELSLSDFQNITSSYFDKLENVISEFLLKHKILPENINNVLLAGGNAQWPMLVEFLEQLVGKNKIENNEYPERALVKGLLFAKYHASLQQIKTSPEVSRSIQPLTKTSPMEISNPKPFEKIEQRGNSFPLWLAFLLEFFPGLFGLLGIGWSIGTGTLFGLPWKWNWKSLIFKIPLLFAWPVLIALFLISLFTASYQFSDMGPLILFFPLWCGIPLISSVFAYLFARKRKD